MQVTGKGNQSVNKAKARINVSRVKTCVLRLSRCLKEVQCDNVDLTKKDVTEFGPNS